MPLLQVRDFPADIYEKIKFQAKQQHRTIAQQTIVLIKKVLDEDISLQEKRRLLFDEIMKRDVPESAKKIDAVKLIREGRER